MKAWLPACLPNESVHCSSETPEGRGSHGGVSFGRWKVTTEAQGPYPLSQRLIDHPAFGRLGLLSLEQIDSTIDDMLGRGEVTEVEEALDEAKSYFLSCSH